MSTIQATGFNVFFVSSRGGRLVVQSTKRTSFDASVRRERTTTISGREGRIGCRRLRAHVSRRFIRVHRVHTHRRVALRLRDRRLGARTNERTNGVDGSRRRTSELGEETWGRTIGFGTMRYVDDARGRARNERLENKGRARTVGRDGCPPLRIDDARVFMECE